MKHFEKFLATSLVCILANHAVAGENSEHLKSLLEKQPACGSFVKFDDQNLYLGFGGTNRGAVAVISLADESTSAIVTQNSALDIVTDGPNAFVLTPDAIEEWDLSSNTKKKSYETYAMTAPKVDSQKASAMARYQDKVIIAHGRLGVSIFNLKTKRLVNQFRLVRNQLPLESSAKGVTVQGRLAYVVLDNYHLVAPPGKPPFRGIVVIDMESEQIVAELDGIDPGVTSVSSDNQYLFVSFGGMPIWKYTLASLQGKTLPEPVSRLWQTPLKGHPTGQASVDDKYYYTCFLQAPSKPGENGGRYIPVPLGMDRSILGLD